MIFWLFPLVLIGITKSLSLLKASTCLLNIFLKLKSFPIAVIALVSVDREIAANAFSIFF